MTDASVIRRGRKKLTHQSFGFASLRVATDTKGKMVPAVAYLVRTTGSKSLYTGQPVLLAKRAVS